jgi:hypothetical protein
VQVGSHDAQDAGSSLDEAKLAELEVVATTIASTLKDTSSVLSKRLEEGAVTLAAVSFLARSLLPPLLTTAFAAASPEEAGARCI